jgi:hypothetical protein
MYAIPNRPMPAAGGLSNAWAAGGAAFPLGWVTAPGATADVVVARLFADAGAGVGLEYRLRRDLVA